jgi:hypothetical protein
VLRLLLVMFLARLAWADRPCSLTEERTFAARDGISSAFIHRYDAPAGVHAVPPAAEIEAGAWVTSATTLTAVAGSYTRFHYTSFSGERWDIAVGRLGGRFMFHSRELPVFFGVGTGATLESARSDTQRERSAALYAELIAGWTIAHAGPLAFQLTGSASSGGMDAFQATLGVAWDPPRPERCADTPRHGFVGALRVGPTYTDVWNTDADPNGWGPWIEGELGARVSEHWALLGFASYTHFTDDPLIQCIGTILVPVHYDVTNIRIGSRAQLWIVPRLFASFGTGIALSPVNWQLADLFVELEVGFQVVRFEHAAIELVELTDAGVAETATSFGIGVSYR